jgi:outer membrane protein assembly factor BamB
MSFVARDGAHRWYPVDLTAQVEQARTGEELRYLDVDTTPVITKSGKDWVVIVASYEGGVFALDADTGMQIWANEGATGITELVLWEWPAHATAPTNPGAGFSATRGDAGTPPPAAAAAIQPGAGSGTSQAQSADAAGKPIRRVLIGSSGLSGLWGFNPDDGKELWHRDVPSGGITAAAAIEGAALVGTTRYGLFLVWPLDGGIIDGLHSGGAFAATPAVHGSRAFMLSNEGVLFGLHVEPPSAAVALPTAAWPELWPEPRQHGDPGSG